MERQRKKTNSRIVRLVLPLIGAALLFADARRLFVLNSA